MSWRRRDRWWQKHDGLPKFSLEPHLTIGPTIKTPRLAFWMFFLFILSVEIHCVWGWSWAPIVKSNLSLGFGGCCHWDTGGRGGNQCWRHPPLPPFSPPAFYHPSPPLCLPTLTFFIHSHIFILNLIFLLNSSNNLPSLVWWSSHHMYHFFFTILPYNMYVLAIKIIRTVVNSCRRSFSWLPLRRVGNRDHCQPPTSTLLLHILLHILHITT